MEACHSPVSRTKRQLKMPLFHFNNVLIEIKIATFIYLLCLMLQ